MFSEHSKSYKSTVFNLDKMNLLIKKREVSLKLEKEMLEICQIHNLS
jgi:hypothetical protein